MGSSAYFCGSHIDPTTLVSQDTPFWAPYSASRRKVELKIILYDQLLYESATALCTQGQLKAFLGLDDLAK